MLIKEPAKKANKSEMRMARDAKRRVEKGEERREEGKTHLFYSERKAGTLALPLTCRHNKW
jgi:hypothetical protein